MIVPQPSGAVHLFMTSELSEHGLPQHANQSMASFHASTRVGENFGRHRSKAEGVVGFPISQQPDVRGHHQSTKPKHQAGSIPTEMLQGPVPGRFLIATGAQVPPAIIKRVSRALIG